MPAVISDAARTKRETFFRIVFGENSGFLCIARRQPNTRTFTEEFFSYPEELSTMQEYIDSFVHGYDLYFCPQLFTERSRKKENVSVTPCLWADLDTCAPDLLRVVPSIVTETSPRRYQALWIISPTIDPGAAEDLSRRIAYAHADDGADKSGWDLTQLLRVPLSVNHKYNVTPLPQVAILQTGPPSIQAEAVEAAYPQVEGFEYADVPFPENMPTESAEELLQQFSQHLKPQFWILYNETPKEDWSKALWQTELFLAEAGMSREQMYVSTSEAACNKYKRDGRNRTHLWREVCKAFAKVEERTKFLPTGEFRFVLPDLLTEEERTYCRTHPTFVERYVEWAKTVGDAAWQYHQAGAFIVLSSLLAGRVRLPTSFGTVLPNLWFMILADTTLTRKTTAMDMAVDILIEVDSDAMLATDGSIEGLMTSLSFRPARPSLFLRDEFAGLLEAMTKKDYYAGMAEAMTKLYDGKYQKRILRKETIEVRDPCLIFFAGGIKTRTMELLTGEQISSGFIPRFIIISAESDVADLRALGPPTSSSQKGRETLIAELRDILQHYVTDTTVHTDGRTITMPKKWDAELTPEAWHRYNRYEAEMVDIALKARAPELATPTFDRLAKSGLKVAVLLAACRKREQKVVVDEQDVIHAFFYIEQWRPHTLEILYNVGQTASERNLNRILERIRKNPDGIMRSQIMQHFHLFAQQADSVFLSLEQRGLITRTKSGKGERIYPAMEVQNE